jgi:hypothetical protein
VETLNRLLNSRNCPYIEAEAINGRGVLETLKEIARLTVPVVRASVFGENISQSEKAGKHRLNRPVFWPLLNSRKRSIGQLQKESQRKNRQRPQLSLLNQEMNPLSRRPKLKFNQLKILSRKLNACPGVWPAKKK